MKKLNLNELPPKAFNVGDKVSYKKQQDCHDSNGDIRYYYGGDCQYGFVGIIKNYYKYIPKENCYKIEVTTKFGGSFLMLESEFEEYDFKKTPHDFLLSKLPKTWCVDKTQKNCDILLDIFKDTQYIKSLSKEIKKFLKEDYYKYIGIYERNFEINEFDYFDNQLITIEEILNILNKFENKSPNEVPIIN